MFAMKAGCFLVAALLALLSLACAGESSPATPIATPDLEATVQAAVAAALPTPRPTPLPDIDATVAAGIAATIIAKPRPAPTQPPTPDIDATVEARMAATIAAMPSPAQTPFPTSTPIPTPTPAPTPTAAPVPTATPSPSPTVTRRPTPTRRPTGTPTPTESPTARLSEMVKQVRPAVVRIESRFSRGTGAIVETQGRTAYIVTNHHVVEGFSEVNVTVNDSDTYRGVVLGTDPVRDLAMVRICCGSFHALRFGDATGLEAGDEVIAIGYALGLSGPASITSGIVSAIRYDPRYQSDVLQTDAAINPGNSGGPMLSMSGEILGINTFRYDESETGRPAEGLGFAISAQTVQGRIPALKAGTPRATPTPTPRPRPTPSGGRADSGIGPFSGELRHDPSDGFIKTEFADVRLSDLVVTATFANPYSASSDSWDYGFILRDSGSGSSVQFMEVVVTSERQWVASWRRGSESGGQEIARGPLTRFDTGTSGENTIWLAAFGQRGLLFVNGEFASSLDLSEISRAGDVAVITGAFTGNERPGAVTRYEGFSIFPLRHRFGPDAGQLRKRPGFIAEQDSGVWARDLVVEAEFSRPGGTAWDYGFIIRNSLLDTLEIIGVAGSGYWFHNSREFFALDYRQVAEGPLRDTGAVLRNRNHLVLLALGDLGLFFLNDALVARLDLSHSQDFGGISAMADFIRGHNGAPAYSNFNVWTP